MLSRRRVLTVVGSGLSVFSGCLSSASTDADTSATTASVPTETPGTPRNAAFANVGISTTRVQCGDTADATITVEGSSLTVVGTVVAPATCYYAVLRTASIPDGTATLDIRVNDDPATDTPCDQCRSEVQFEVTGKFVGGRPTQITVELHGESPKTVQKSV